ncbi:MAG: SIS domain-containing protein [Sporichthyaceae bacterium]
MAGLDDPVMLAALDSAGMIAAVASAGAQLRAAPDYERADAETPRAVVVAGMGGSAASGDVLAAVVGPGASFPVVVVRGHHVPGWVGAQDRVFAVSCSGTTEETLGFAAQAQERGIALTTIGAAGSPLSKFGVEHLDVDAEGRPPRACLWGLAAPLLATADSLGFADADAGVRLAAANDLDEIAARCAPDVPTAQNPAKALALGLVGGLPLIWGFSPLAATAAQRLGNQIAENAKLPSVVGGLSEPHHNQVVAFDGPLGRHARDLGLRPVILRDAVEDPRLVRRAEESMRLAADYGLPAIEVCAAGTHPLQRLASLVGLLDWASVYLALALEIDPTPIGPIDTLKARLAEVR